MPLTRKVTSAPVIIPSDAEDATATPAGASTKATSAPGPRHVRVHRSAGTGSERIIGRPVRP